MICEPQELLIKADEDKISQVFIDLLSNALKYTPSGGTVEIKATSTDKHVDVRICDNGIGIPE